MKTATDMSGTRAARTRRWLVIIVATALILLTSGVLGGYYLSAHRMQPVQEWESGPSASADRVLIAMQGSPFKDQLVSALVHRLQPRGAYLRIIDIAGLAHVNAAEWDAVVLVHTWEVGRPPLAVTRFLARASGPRHIVDVTTSGSGREKIPGIDVLSSASTMDEIPALVESLESRIVMLLAGS